VFFGVLLFFGAGSCVVLVVWTSRREPPSGGGLGAGVAKFTETVQKGGFLKNTSTRTEKIVYNRWPSKFYNMHENTNIQHNILYIIQIASTSTYRQPMQK